MILKNVKLGEVAEIKNGKSRPKSKGSVPVYGGNGILDYCLESNVSGEAVVIGRVGAYCGAVYYENRNIWVSDNALYLKPVGENDSKFFYYLLKNKNLNQYAGGSSHPLLTQGRLNDLELNLPPLPTQKAIAEILSSLDDKIELNNKINQNLEALAQALFKQWFVDFEFPFDFAQGRPNENGDSYKSSGGEMVDSELGEIPKGWEVFRLKELLTIKRGGSPRPIQDYMADFGLPWVKISDATALNNPFLFETKEFIKPEGLKKTVLMKKGSLVLSNSATPGLPIFLELDACIHDGWLHFQDIKKLSYNYLYLFFLEIRKDLVGKGNGSIFINLKTDILKEYQISIGPNEILSRFNKVVDPIFENIKHVALENRSLTQLRDTLLPKLISGELEVSQLKNEVYD